MHAFFHVGRLKKISLHGPDARAHGPSPMDFGLRSNFCQLVITFFYACITHFHRYIHSNRAPLVPTCVHTHPLRLSTPFITCVQKLTSDAYINAFLPMGTIPARINRFLLSSGTQKYVTIQHPYYIRFFICFFLPTYLQLHFTS